MAVVLSYEYGTIPGVIQDCIKGDVGWYGYHCGDGGRGEGGIWDETENESGRVIYQLSTIGTHPSVLLASDPAWNLTA